MAATTVRMGLSGLGAGDLERGPTELALLRSLIVKEELPAFAFNTFPPLSTNLGREPIISEWSADGCFGAHTGLKSDIA